MNVQKTTRPIKHKPVKHLADCDICFVLGTDGYRTRNKTICKRCEAYPKCDASQTDRTMNAVLQRINKLHIY